MRGDFGQWQENLPYGGKALLHLAGDPGCDHDIRGRWAGLSHCDEELSPLGGAFSSPLPDVGASRGYAEFICVNVRWARSSDRCRGNDVGRTGGHESERGAPSGLVLLPLTGSVVRATCNLP